MDVWYPNYQPRDWELIDYQEFRIAGCEVPFRGPGLDPFAAVPGSFFSCIGAAQTYGCFYQHPFPTIVSEALQLPVMNLAVGGAGPGFYPQMDTVIEAMNRGRFVVLQAMSGRSESNARYAANGYVEFVRDRATGEVVTSSDAWHTLAAENLDAAEQRVAESRQSWIESSHRLLSRLTVPVIFFWFSRRTPDYTVDRAAVAAQLQQRAAGEKTSFFVDGLVGEFPQLIDRATMRAVADRCAGYAECYSSRGMNQPLINRFTGQPFADAGLKLGPEYGIDYTKNAYYPSAEMHEDAAAALLPVVQRVLAASPQPSGSSFTP
jgi:hypothetical protein